MVFCQFPIAKGYSDKLSNTLGPKDAMSHQPIKDIMENVQPKQKCENDIKVVIKHVIQNHPLDFSTSKI